MSVGGGEGRKRDILKCEDKNLTDLLYKKINFDESYPNFVCHVWLGCGRMWYGMRAIQ